MRNTHKGSKSRAFVTYIKKVLSRTDIQIFTEQCQHDNLRLIYEGITVESLSPLMLDATEDIFIIFPDFCLIICKRTFTSFKLFCYLQA